MGKYQDIVEAKIGKRKPKAKKPTIPNPETGVEEAIDDPHRLAKIYLRDYPNTVRWREDWYSWTDPAYSIQTDDDIKSELVELIKEEFDCIAGGEGQPEAPKITKTLLSNVLENLKALTHQYSTKEEPFWL